MKPIVLKNFTSLPATFVEVSPNSESSLYTRAKLKVFYVGTTADGRLFTETFSKRLLESIGYTPVVSKYNPETEDFEGHASQQNIYGIVDPVTAPTFEKDEAGREWAVCDVILYTERPDNTGAIAQKIIGHPQSLELNSNTVQYKINRDPQTGGFLNLEFIAGEFIGVSVLGKDERPAFTGSEFFNGEFVKKFEQIKGYCENRGGKMDLLIPTFVEQSWNEMQKEVSSKLYEKYGYEHFSIRDMYDDYCVAYMWDAEKEAPQLVKITYAVKTDESNTQLELGEPIQVRVVYEEIRNVEEEKPVLTPVDTQASDENISIEKEIEDDKDDEEEDEKVEECSSEPTEPKVTTNEENTVNSSSLSDIEREELEAYRKQIKIALIQEYKDTIPAAELDVYIETVDSYDKTALENALNKRFVEITKNTPKQEFKNNRFVWAPEPSTQSESLTEAEKLAQAIRERKKRGINNA